SQPACTHAPATIYPVSQPEDCSPAHSHQPPSQQAASCSSTPAGQLSGSKLVSWPEAIMYQGIKGELNPSEQQVTRAQ
ncbi:hypothetical protein DSO57_1027735, partial [Entomophthora muscae]